MTNNSFIVYRLYALLILILFTGNISMAQEDEDHWKDEMLAPKANFFKIRKEFSEEIEEEKKENISIYSRTRNVTPIQENEYNKYRRWEWYMNSHINPDGTLPSGNELNESYQTFQRLVSKKKSSRTASNSWKNISRTTNAGGYYGMGRTSWITFHPTNPDIFYVCGQTGGVWKTTNGGQSYQPLGDELPFLGAGALAIDNNNPSTLYICTGDHTGGIGMGVYKSTDGGATWNPTGLIRNLEDQVSFYDLKILPSNSSIIFAATSQGLYRSSNAGSSWSRISSSRCTDIEFKTDNSNTVYAMLNRKLYQSTNQGSSFAAVGNAPTLPNNGIAHLDVTKANANKILIWSHSAIYTSSNAGNTWTQAALPPDTPETLVISDFNDNIIFGGAVDFFRTDNNGQSWYQIGDWCCASGSVAEVHADHRNSFTHPLTGAIFSCNDGGIDKYNENSNQWSRLSNGLVIPQYYSAASSTDGSIVDVGSQDNGGSRRLANMQWINTNGGDAGTQAIDPRNADVAYSNYNPSPAIIRTTNGWRNFTEVKPNDNVTSWWVIPYVLDPNNANNIIVAYHAVYKSTNRGDSWTKISPDFAAANDYWNACRTIAVAPSNSNYIYTAQSRTLHYTTNGGSSWSESYFDQEISDICVNPNNANVVYVTCSQFANGNKVFKSTNAGQTWTNISANLPNIPVHSIVYQNSTNDMLYIGTDFGVFYKDNNMSSWQVYGESLPHTTINDLHINYAQMKLRAATYGRGIYEVDLGEPQTEQCSAPENYTASNITNTSVHLSWNASAAASSYYIYYQDKADGTWILGPSGLTGTETDLYDLQPGTNYTATVTVICENGDYLTTYMDFSTTNNTLINNGIYEIKSNLPAHRCIDVAGISPDAGANVHLWDDLNGSNQRWQVSAISNGIYKLVPQHTTDKALDLNAGNDANGENIQIWTYDGEYQKRWRIIHLYDNIYKIKPESSDRCIDVADGTDENGTNIRIWEDNGTNAQQWIFELIEAPVGSAISQSPKADSNNASNQLIKPYPNPTSDEFSITYFNEKDNKNQLMNLEITDLQGKTVLTEKYNLSYGLNTFKIKTSTFSHDGLYIISITTTGSKKVITEKIFFKQ